MTKTSLIFGLSIAAAAFGLRWLEYQHMVRIFATEIYIVCIAIAFTILGAWVGHKLTRGERPKIPGKNTRALKYLGVSHREYEVLQLLAEGHTNKEIADKLFVSPNTIKTHLTHLYEKLGVSRRTAAIRKASALRLIA